MRLSYNAVRAWLTANGSSCSLDQLQSLDQLIGQSMQTVRESESKYQLALQQAQAAASSVGLSVEELLRRARPIQAQAAAPGGPAPRTNVRKPYLNPLLDDGVIYSVNAKRPKPEWLVEAEQAGYTLAECHFRNLGNAWRARGVKPLYSDPVTRHAELVAQEPVRFQRQPRNRD